MRYTLFEAIFEPHDVLMVEEAGFKGLKNGRLLESASGQYDVLVTVDQIFSIKDNLQNFSVAVIVLKAKRSTYPMLKPLMPKVLENS